MGVDKPLVKLLDTVVAALKNFSAASLFVGLTLLSVLARADNAPRIYSGDIWNRTTLTGDWGGARNELAAKGVTADLDVTQIEQGVVSGGKERNWEYGGHGALTVNFDSGKLGLWSGTLLTLALEGNFSNSVNNDTGAVMPVNSLQTYPFPNGDNLNLSELAITQSISNQIGLVFGKILPTYDANEFAAGIGDTQFFNLALTSNPVTSMVTPYSTLGAVLNVAPTTDANEVFVNFSIIQTNGNSKTSGFDDLSAGKLTFMGEGRVRTNIFGLTGHQDLGVEYSNQTFTSLGQNVRFIGVTGTFAAKDGSWDAWYNFDQYLYEQGSGRGIGLFGRLGISDGNPNPIQYFYSLGVGGKGVLRGRPNDEFGLGYYYIKISNITLQGQLANGTIVNRSLFRNEYGFEAYYKIAVTPWMLLTPDLQIIRPAQKQQVVSPFGLQGINTARVFGVRLQLLF